MEEAIRTLYREMYDGMIRKDRDTLEQVLAQKMEPEKTESG